MNNTQVATLIQNLLMVAGSALIGTHIGNATVMPVDVQTIFGGLSTLAGFFWNHWSQAVANRAS